MTESDRTRQCTCAELVWYQCWWRTKLHHLFIIQKVYLRFLADQRLVLAGRSSSKLQEEIELYVERNEYSLVSCILTRHQIVHTRQLLSKHTLRWVKSSETILSIDIFSLDYRTLASLSAFARRNMRCWLVQNYLAHSTLRVLSLSEREFLHWEVSKQSRVSRLFINKEKRSDIRFRALKKQSWISHSTCIRLKTPPYNWIISSCNFADEHLARNQFFRLEHSSQI